LSATQSKSDDVDGVLTCYHRRSHQRQSDTLHVLSLDVHNRDVKPVEDANASGALWMVVEGEDQNRVIAMSTPPSRELRRGGKPGART
jgi:hypothetical protein